MTESQNQPQHEQPTQGGWTAFIGGSWLWGKAEQPGYRKGLILGDQVGFFRTWSDACEYLLENWPLAMLTDDSDPLSDEQVKSYQEDFEDLIRWVSSPGIWQSVPHAPAGAGEDEAALRTETIIEAVRQARDAQELDDSLLKAEIAHFWETHDVT